MSITRSRVSLGLAWVGLAAFATPAWGQRVLSPFDDASVLPRGMIRATVAPTFTRWHERFADGLARAAKGNREPFAADVDLDSLTVDRLPLLAATETAVTSLLGAGRVSLGRLQSRYDVSATFTQLGLEYGLTRRITLGGMLPMVRFRNEVSVIPNPGGTEANIGFNPAFANAAARTLNGQVVSQLTAAAQQLQSRLASCLGSSDPSCTTINADRARAQQLVTAAASAATGIENLYGVSTAKPGQRFAPVLRGTLQNAVGSRLETLATDFARFLGTPPAATGTTWVDARPAGAAPMTHGDLQTLLTDKTIGIGADSLVSVQRHLPGDLELGAKILLLDTFGGDAPQLSTRGGPKLRLSLAGAYRFGTGTVRLPTSFADLGTGDGQADLEGRAYADVMFGRRFWFTAAGRYVRQRPDVPTVRVPIAPHEPFPVAAREAAVDRDLGDIVAAELSPRLVVFNSIGLSASYSYLRKSSDRFSAGPTTPNASTLDLSTLEAGTARTEQRASIAVTYSTMTAYYARRAKLPVEVSYTLSGTVAGDGGAPRQSAMALTLRVHRR